MNNLTANEEYIDLGEIISALFRRIGLIMLITVLCGAAGFVYARFVATPLYSASAMMIVNSGQRSQDYVSTDQLRSAASLVDTYSIIVRSDTVMDKVIQRRRTRLWTWWRPAPSGWSARPAPRSSP